MTSKFFSESNQERVNRAVSLSPAPLGGTKEQSLTSNMSPRRTHQQTRCPLPLTWFLVLQACVVIGCLLCSGTGTACAQAGYFCASHLWDLASLHVFKHRAEILEAQNPTSQSRKYQTCVPESGSIGEYMSRKV